MTLVLLISIVKLLKYKNVFKDMRFSQIEKKDLFYAGFMISLAFAILLSGGLLNLNVTIFLIAFFTAGLGFLLHEVMHKYVAQSYSLWAEFRANYKMLWLAVLFSFFGFIFAAPGAVYIRGLITEAKNGKISLAGPVTNLVLAFMFLILIFFVPTNNLVLDAFF